MYKNKNRNKGVKISLIVALFAVLLGCLVLFAGNQFSVAENVSAESNVQADDGDKIEADKPAAQSTATNADEGIMPASAETLAAAWDEAVENNGTFTLTEDWIAIDNKLGSGTYFYSGGLHVPSGKTVTLDLHGHTIDRGLPGGTYHGFAILVQGNLTIDDTVGGGKIFNAGSELGTVGVLSGTCTLVNGTISQSCYYSSGGDNEGVVSADGTFIMRGGAISGNKIAGVRIASSGSFIMEGGVISDSKYGINLSEGATYTYTGGEISNIEKSEFVGTSTAWAAAVNHSISKNTKVGFKVGSAWKAKSEGGSYSFGKGVGFTPIGAIYVPENADIALDLGGREINAMDVYDSTIIVEGTLTLDDTVGGGNITGRIGHAIGGPHLGGAIYVKYGKLVMNGGKISGIDGLSNAVIGAVAADYGSVVEMNGGTISDNNLLGGGGVYTNSDSTFIMNDGEIINNTTSSEGGGGVLTFGRFIMNGGAISGNTTTKKGGGVYMNGGTFEMTGGTISGNSANYGGGIWASESVYIYNGNISHNAAINGGGGGVYTEQNLYLYDGSISYNSASYAGGVYAGDGLTMTNGTIGYNELGTTVTVEHMGCGGGVLVNGPSGVNLIGGSIVNNVAFGYGGGIYLLGNSSGSNLSGGSITGNVARSGGCGIYGNGLITVSGANIDNNGNFSDNAVGGGIYLASGELRLISGSINGNKGMSNGVGLYISGTLNISGGSISNNCLGWAPSYGVGVYISTGTINMTGGEISNNSGTEFGAGVYVSSNSQFNMSGGSITSNKLSSTTAAHGPGVYVDSNSTFTMTGGSITDNTFGSGSVGDVYIDGNFKVSGACFIKAVILGSNKKITVTGSLIGGHIGIVPSTTGVFTEGYGTYNGYEPSIFFVSTTSSYRVVKSGAEASLSASSSPSKSYIEWRYGKNLTTAGDYTSISYQLSATIKYTGETYLVGAYSGSSSTASAIAIAGKEFKDANGNSIATTTAIKNVGTYSFVVNSTAYHNASFTLVIEPADIASTNISISDQIYTGSALTPKPVIMLNGTTLVEGINNDYEIDRYNNNINVGTATVGIQGCGNYTGYVTKSFTINPRDISTTTATLSASAYTYSGNEFKPTVTVKYGTTTVSTEYYIVSYSNNVNAGTAMVILTGTGNYTGTATKAFTINPFEVLNSMVTLKTTTYTYDGFAKNPEVSVANGSTVIPSESYSLAYSNNVNASSTATVTLTFSGNYTGTVSQTFTINPASINSATVTFGVSNYVYTGSAITPVPTVTLGSTTLAQNGDFTIEYANNVNAGTGKVTINGKGNYTGTVAQNFTIDKKTVFISGISISDKPYDGTTAATVDTSKIVISGAVASDLSDLGVTLAEGNAFESAQVGLQKVVITGLELTGAKAGNYTVESDSVERYAQIYPATVKITGIVANGKDYDGTTAVTFDLSGATITGALASELDDLLANLTVNGYFDSKNAGQGVSVTVSGYRLGGEYAGNYVIDFENSDKTLTADIEKAQLEVTLGKSEYTVTYGNALKITYSQNSPVKSESVALALEYWDENGNAKLAGVPSDAGKYLVKVVVDPEDANLPNYIVKTTGEGLISQAKVTIEKATLTVTVEDKTITYGDAKPADGDYVLIYNGWLNGDAAAFEGGSISFVTPVTISTDYDPADETNKNAGKYAIALSDGELKNYEITFVDGTLTVKAKKITVVIDDKSSAYGAAEQTLTSDAASVAVDGDDLQISLKRADATNKNVGKYAITGTSANGNYDVTFIDGVYEITKAKLTVTANANSITYGEEAAEDGVTYGGFVNGEDEAVLGGTLGYRFTYTQYGDIFETGTTNRIAYYIIPYGLTADNYEIEFVNGLLTVNKKEATVTVSNATSDITSVPSDRAEAAKTVKYAVSGAVNGDDLQILLTIAETGENGVYAVNWCAVGVYKITGTAGNSNYDVTFAFDGGANYGTYTVSQGTLIITANTLIIGYGENIAFSSDIDEALTAEGLPLGSTLKDLIDSGVVSGTLSVVAYGDAAYDAYASMGSAYKLGGDIFDSTGNRISYIVIPTGLNSSSYNIIFKPGKLMIEPKSIIVTLDNKSSVYGEEEKELTASVADGALVNFDPSTDKVTEFLGITGLAKAAGSDAGNYAITATECSNKNYRVTFVNGVYTIEQYGVTVKWVSGNEDDTDFNYTYNGAAQAPVATFEMPDGTVYKSTDETDKFIEITGSGMNAGSYKAQAFLLNANLKFADGTDVTQLFTIAQKQLKVTWYASNDDKGDASKVIVASSTVSTPIEYKYVSRKPYAPVVVLEGIEAKDDLAGFYYISGEQSEVSVTPYAAVLNILNANYCIASADSTVYFVIVKGAPGGFAWYENADYATQISSLKEYVYNGEVQHPVAKALQNEEFVYAIYDVSGDTEKKVISTINVGTYKIVARPLDGNLELSDSDATFYFNIVAKEVTVTWSATTFEYNGQEQVPSAYYEDVLGQKVYLTVNGDKGVNANEDGSVYTVSVTLETDNYTFVVDGANTDTLETTYTITPKEITVTWTSKYTNENGTPKWEMVYANSDESESVTPEVTMVNAVEPVSLKMTVWYQSDANDTPVQVNSIRDAGVYTLRVALADETPNYSITDAEQSFTITKRELTITATDKKVNTGALIPTLTATYEGFADGEDAASLGLKEADWLATNYNLSSPYIAESDYTADGDIKKLETISDVASGNYTGYFIALTDSEARLEELNAILSNYDWSFKYGRMIIIAVEGDVSIVLTQYYNGEDQLPTAKYKVGDKWLDLKVEVYKDSTYSEKLENPEVKNVGDYYVLLRKYDDDNVTLKGAETSGALAGCVKKTFTINEREITVKISDKSVTYGEVTESNYATYLESLWSYAVNDALYQPLEGDELEITLSVNFVFDKAGFAVVRKNGDSVVGYEITGSWSEDETIRRNYNVIFKGNDGATGLFTVTNAKISFYENTGDYNQIIEQGDSMKMALAEMEGDAYKYFSFAGNQNASVEIYYSTAYNLDNNNPDSFPPEKDEMLKNKLLSIAPDFVSMGKDSRYFVNFMIVIANHETYYGQWTAEVLNDTVYIRIVFLKEYSITYGENIPDGKTLADELWNGGYIDKNGTGIQNKFQEYIDNGLVTARVVSDFEGLLSSGSYSIVFEGLENISEAKYEISYKQDLNGVTEPTNLNKFVVEKCKITLDWDKVSFVYDGEAHLPTPTIEGWTMLGSTQSGLDTVYTFKNDATGAKFNLVVKTNGGDFTTVGSENIVTAEIEDGNYELDSFNATRAVSILSDEDIGGTTVGGGMPAWLVWVLVAAAVVAVLAIIALAVKLKKRKANVDEDGFYEDADIENS